MNERAEESIITRDRGFSPEGNMHQALEGKRFGIAVAYRCHKVSRLDVFGAAA